MPEKYHVSGDTKNGSCVLVGKMVCGLFSKIAVMSVAGVQGNFESKNILHIFSCGSQTHKKTHIYVRS